MIVPLKRSRGKSVRLFLLCIILFPLTVFLHELAHWLVARMSGFSAHLHFASVDGFPDQAPFGGAPDLVAAIALAGPAVTLALIVTGIANSSRIWALPLVAAALSRFIVNVMFAFQQVLVIAGIARPSQPKFDEVDAAQALSLPPLMFAGVGALTCCIGLVWLWRRAGMRDFLVLAVGTITGMIAWLGVFGQMVLP